jgi:Holliday junction resolvase RusA-like endonuclease
VIRFRVNGIPAPQGSKRHVGNGRMVESSKAVGPWREAVRAEAQRVREAAGWQPLAPGQPASVTLVFALGRPRTHYGTGRNAGQEKASAPHFPAGRPDVDKLARAVLDGLTEGGVLEDDGQVVSLVATKIWAHGDMPEGALIMVEACDGE